MEQFIISIIATISVLSLVIYDFLCVCRIAKKEEWVERLWKYFFPDKPYNEKYVFLITRSMFLWISFLAYILSGGAGLQILVYRIMLIATIPLSVGATIRNLQS